MIEKNKQLIRDYFDEVLKGDNPKPKYLIDKYISDQDYELKSHIEVFEVAFPLYCMHILDMIAEGNKVTVRFQFEGIHVEEFMGIPPSGKKASFEGIIIYQIESNKIINHWMSVDKAELIRQIQPEEAEVLL